MKSGVLLSLLTFICAFAFSQSPELGALYAKKVAAVNEGNLQMALSWSVKAADKAKEEFGETDMYANYAADLAQLYYQLLRYDDARILFEKVESIYSKSLGVNHTYTAVINNNLGNLYRFKGDNEKALNAYEKSLEAYRQNLGVEHEYYRMALNSIIDLCQHAGYYEVLEQLYRTQRSNTGLKDRTSMEYVGWTNNLAMVLEHTGKLTEIESLYKECISIALKDKQTFSDVLPTLYGNLGDYYLKNNRLDDAENAIERAVDPAHESYSTQLNNLAMVYERKKNYNAAASTYTKALNHLSAAGQDTSSTYRAIVYNAVQLFHQVGRDRKSVV